MSRVGRRIHWRTAAIGLASTGVLAGLWILLPARAPAAEGLARDTVAELHRALAADDVSSLRRCTRTLRAGLHRDLLSRHIPGLLRVTEALAATSRRCRPDAPAPFDRGICALRQLRYGDALLAFGDLPAERGGAAFREIAAQLLARQRTGAPPPAGKGVP